MRPTEAEERGEQIQSDAAMAARLMEQGGLRAQQQRQANYNQHLDANRRANYRSHVQATRQATQGNASSSENA